MYIPPRNRAVSAFYYGFHKIDIKRDTVSILNECKEQCKNKLSASMYDVENKKEEERKSYNTTNGN